MSKKETEKIIQNGIEQAFEYGELKMDKVLWTLIRDYLKHQ